MAIIKKFRKVQFSTKDDLYKKGIVDSFDILTIIEELEKRAKENNEIIPKDYIDYSFHSYTTQPLGTAHLKPEEILKFRDEAFTKYHNNPMFLKKNENKFENKI